MNSETVLMDLIDLVKSSYSNVQLSEICNNLITNTYEDSEIYKLGHVLQELLLIPTPTHRLAGRPLMIARGSLELPDLAIRVHEALIVLNGCIVEPDNEAIRIIQKWRLQ